MNSKIKFLKIIFKSNILPVTTYVFIEDRLFTLHSINRFNLFQRKGDHGYLKKIINNEG